MGQSRKTAVVICPGRGTYNKSELGYLSHHHADKVDLINAIDTYRKQDKQTHITELDQAKVYDPKMHSRGDNASSLIYACAYADFLSIDQEKFDIVGITGNSMGWYIALACANSLNPTNALKLINTMGNLMHQQSTGGQLIYPLVDDNWQPITGRIDTLTRIKDEINQQGQGELFDSIYLGGMRVFAGHDAALDILMNALVPEQHFPLRLANHAAFHSPLMQDVSEQARALIPKSYFQPTEIPMIDGRGHIWQPWSSDAESLCNYTLGHQIVKPYNFNHAIEVSAKEFAPDCLIILGPGNTLGGATAQALINFRWQDLRSKQDFIARQQTEPFILSMGLDEQREMVL